VSQTSLRVKSTRVLRFGTRTLAGLLLLTLSSGSPAVAVAAAQSPANQAMAAYVDAVNDYVVMHRRLENAVGRIDINSTPDSINRSIAALATAIRAERPHARQGDLFTPALGHELRARINGALLEHGFTAADILRSGRADELIDPSTVRLQVNGTFPWVLAAAMFPCVIEALPPLPSELQYRIVGNDLVLIDVHASLIVDILPNALADVTVLNWRPEGVVR